MTPHDLGLLVALLLPGMLLSVLLLSTFAIVLGGALVVGTFVFSDTLNRSFTSLFASTVGDVVVRPEGGDAPGGGPSSRAVPGTLVDQLAAVPSTQVTFTLMP